MNCIVTQQTDSYLRMLDKYEHQADLLALSHPINKQSFRGFRVDKDCLSIEWALSNTPDLFDAFIEAGEDTPKAQAFIDALPFSVIEQFLYEYAQMHSYQKMAYDFLT